MRKKSKRFPPDRRTKSVSIRNQNVFNRFGILCRVKIISFKEESKIVRRANKTYLKALRKKINLSGYHRKDFLIQKR